MAIPLCSSFYPDLVTDRVADNVDLLASAWKVAS